MGTTTAPPSLPTTQLHWFHFPCFCCVYWHPTGHWQGSPCSYLGCPPYCAPMISSSVVGTFLVSQWTMPWNAPMYWTTISSAKSLLTSLLGRPLPSIYLVPAFCSLFPSLNTLTLSPKTDVNDMVDNLLASVRPSHSKVSPLTAFAVASILEGAPFVSGPPDHRRPWCHPAHGARKVLHQWRRSQVGLDQAQVHACRVPRECWYQATLHRVLQLPW